MAIMYDNESSIGEGSLRLPIIVYNVHVYHSIKSCHSNSKNTQYVEDNNKKLDRLKFSNNAYIIVYLQVNEKFFKLQSGDIGMV